MKENINEAWIAFYMEGGKRRIIWFSDTAEEVELLQKKTKKQKVLIEAVTAEFIEKLTPASYNGSYYAI